MKRTQRTALPKVIIFDIAADKPEDRVAFWTPIELPDSVSIGHLPILLTSYRTFVRQERKQRGSAFETLAGIPETGIERLLLHAYQASFLTDEGRQVRTRIAVPSERVRELGNHLLEAVDNPNSVLSYFSGRLDRIAAVVEEENLHSIRFQTPIPLDGPKPLAKLAPVLSGPGGAITVQEWENRLVVTGIAQLDKKDSDRRVVGMPRDWTPAAGLLIDVLGPGHLRVKQGQAEFTLFADRLVTHELLIGIKPIDSWLWDVSLRLATEFKSDPSYSADAGLFGGIEHAEKSGTRVPLVDLIILFKHMLGECLTMGHGGAFAFVPDITAAPIRLKHPVRPVDLGEELKELWKAECDVWRSQNPGEKDQLSVAAEKLEKAHQWMGRLRSAGRLSAADGCVVFDRNLVLHGFGGSIHTHHEERRHTKCIEWPSGTEAEADDLLKLHGERHKSAYALCDIVPNAIVLVVSQDGDIKMFASDQEAVYFASNLRP